MLIKTQLQVLRSTKGIKKNSEYCIKMENSREKTNSNKKKYRLYKWMNKCEKLIHEYADFAIDKR